MGKFNVTRSVGGTVEVVAGNVAVVPCPGLPPSRPSAVVQFDYNGARITPFGQSPQPIIAT